MRTSVVFLVVMPLLAAGCSNPSFYWYHPDRTFEEAKTDYCECRDKASRQADEAVADEYFNHLRSPARSGYSYDSLPPDDASADVLDAQATWGELYEQNAFNGCMRSRGYVQLKAHRIRPGLRTKDLPMGAIAGR